MRSRSLLLLAIVSALMCGCAILPAHPPLPTADALPQDPYGSYIFVKTQGGMTAGELLAVSSDSTVYVLVDRKSIVSIRDRDVKSATLVRFNPQAAGVAGLTIGGVLTTLSNGWGLIFTAPAWILVGTGATAARSHEPEMSLHKHNWQPMLPYSRFPAGLPPGFLTTPPPPPPVVVVQEETPPASPAPSEPVGPKKVSPRIQHFAMNFAPGVSFHENGFHDLEQSGWGLISGVNFETRAAFFGTRCLLAHREVTGDSFDPEWQESGESVDLALLLGAQGQIKRVHVEFGIGPATYGAKIADAFDFKFSLAYQAGLTVNVTPQLGLGGMLAYNQNEFRDFYVVALGLRFVVW